MATRSISSVDTIVKDTLKVQAPQECTAVCVGGGKGGKGDKEKLCTDDSFVTPQKATLFFFKKKRRNGRPLTFSFFSPLLWRCVFFSFSVVALIRTGSHGSGRAGAYATTASLSCFARWQFSF
nr:hypothetical protein [Pandoravirus aubagnensis]